MISPQDYATNVYSALEAKKRLLEEMLQKYQNLMSVTDAQLRILKLNIQLFMMQASIHIRQKKGHFLSQLAY